MIAPSANQKQPAVPERFKARALVFDASSAREPAELRALYDFFHALVPNLAHCGRAVVLSAGRIVADGPCLDLLEDAALLAAHDLELPAGFDPRALVERAGQLAA